MGKFILDHDPCSNYGEWASMAMVAVAPTEAMPLGLKGRGPSKDKGFAGKAWQKNVMGDCVFDPWEQARQYDRSEEFVRHWIPELRSAPAGYSHWASRTLGHGKYPKPMISNPFEHDGSAVPAQNKHKHKCTYAQRGKKNYVTSKMRQKHSIIARLRARTSQRAHVMMCLK